MKKIQANTATKKMPCFKVTVTVQNTGTSTPSRPKTKEAPTGGMRSSDEDDYKFQQ